MIIDISAKIRRLILTGLPLAMLGCADRVPGTTPPSETVDASGDGTMLLCFEKQIIPIRDDRNLIEVGFDPADPRWADLYQECGRRGLYCSRFCEELSLSSPRPPGGAGGLSGCAVRCGSGENLAIATLQFSGPVPGRRPPDYVARLSDGPGTSPGAYFAECAALEAASIPAFRLLARELTEHAAPLALVRRARAAMKDEARHFRQVRRLARRYQGPAPARPNPPLPVNRNLEEIARHNAVEGCVRETFGAVIAAWQAQTAHDPVVRATMRAVACDEAAHAQLAWDVHAWALARLGAQGKAAVAEARTQAVAELVAAAGAPVEPALVHAAGLPAAHQARWLATRATTTLWSSYKQSPRWS